MSRLYQQRNRVPFIEGVVTQITQYNQLIHEIIQYQQDTEVAFVNVKRHLFIPFCHTELKLDSFQGGQLVIPNSPYRIDSGTFVRLYSVNGFKKTDEHGIFTVHGVQVFGQRDKIVFQAVNIADVRFR